MRNTAPQIAEIRSPVTDFKLQILRSFLNRLVSFINQSIFGNITTSDIISVNFAAVNRATPVIHNLGRVPKGFLVLNHTHAGAAAISFSANPNTWTTTTITLTAQSTLNTPFTALIVVI